MHPHGLVFTSCTAAAKAASVAGSGPLSAPPVALGMADIGASR
jgi:hypothetical protein